jgi:hypothetical protein
MQWNKVLSPQGKVYKMSWYVEAEAWLADEF